MERMGEPFVGESVSVGLVYPLDFEERIGVDGIRSEVAGLAQSDQGRQIIEGLTFSADASWIRGEQDLLREYQAVLNLASDFPRDGYVSLGEELLPLWSEGDYLREGALSALRTLALTAQSLIHFAENHAEYPHFGSLARAIRPPAHLGASITEILDADGLIRDTASADLQGIRRRLRGRMGQVQETTERLLRSLTERGVVDSSVRPSVHGGRLTIPVSAAGRSGVQGVVVARSASGQTLFVVPYALLELEQEIAQLEAQEREECIKVLTLFTERWREEREAIRNMVERVHRCDALLARARYGQLYGGAAPILSDEPGILRLRCAHHPQLLRKKQKAGRPGESIPVSLELDATERILLISGPNAGGKSVTLKTVAAAVYMHQCGFLPMVGANSELSIFSHLYLDIGDQQSIRDDLSTFSSHLVALAHITARAGVGDLFFIDELGTGTEPQAGASIAEAVMEHLAGSGAQGVVTTHLGNLKRMPERLPAILNAAMRFDAERLVPLYELDTHVMGSSYAFAMAARLGLDERLIARAQELVGSGYVTFERELEEASRARLELEEQRGRIARLLAEAEKIHAQTQEAHDRLKDERRDIIARARREAQTILAESNRAVERTIREIRERDAEKQATRQARERLGRVAEELEAIAEKEAKESRRDQRRRIDRVKPAAAAQSKTAAQQGQLNTETSDAIAPGTRVYLEGQPEIEGEVVSIDGRRAVVSFGQLLSTVDPDRLVVVSRGASKRRRHRAGSEGAQTRRGSALAQRKLNFHSEIDVRGSNSAEAVGAVENLIDDAILVGVHRVRILHGKGSGALQRAVGECLRDHPAVEGYAFEDERFGGAGITIVDLK